MTNKIKLILIIGCFITIQLGNVKISYAQKDLYLLIGQSNMSGRAPIKARDKKVLKRVYLLNNLGKWVSAKNPFNRYSNIRKKLSMQKLDPGYSFARYLSDKYPTHTIYLVVNARGGTKIMEWTKGSYYYDSALFRIRYAMKTASLKAIIWHQGESDSKDTTNYMKKLRSMVYNFRKDLNRPRLPFIAGETGRWKPIHKNINKVIDEIPKYIKYSAVVSSKGLSHIESKSNPHFNERSQLILGDRYAKKVIQMVYDNR